MTYTTNYPHNISPSSPDIRVTLRLDTGAIIGPPRLHFLSLEGASSRSFSVRLSIGRNSCSSDWVYVAVSINQKLS